MPPTDGISGAGWRTGPRLAMAERNGPAGIKRIDTIYTNAGPAVQLLMIGRARYRELAGESGEPGADAVPHECTDVCCAIAVERPTRTAGEGRGLVHPTSTSGSPAASISTAVPNTSPSISRS